MKFRFTPLNVAVGAYVLGVLLYTLLHYTQLSSGEGWGVVYMVALAAYGMLALFADFWMQFLIRPYKALNVASTAATILAVFLWLYITYSE